MKSIRISYADYKKINIKSVNNSYDAATKTIEVSTLVNDYDDVTFDQYFAQLNKTVSEYAAEAGMEVTDDVIASIDSYKQSIIDCMISTYGSEYTVLAKYC